MNSKLRKKSPRAPSISLGEALDRALRAYESDRLHPAPTDVFAQNIGYKSANNGAALSALASLRYFGLAQRPSEGMLAVTKEVESFKFAPNDEMRHVLLLSFLRSPELYSELLDKYSSGLPSDANLRYELIQRGFSPTAAEQALATFKRSVEAAGYFDLEQPSEDAAPGKPISSESESMQGSPSHAAVRPVQERPVPSLAAAGEMDEIPVRLPGGRRAILLIPTPFYDADKGRLKAQIDLLLTDEDE